jgi:tetratricopeptide (TPR) repeat protein
VIPVLVGGATFPRKAELPESLRPLCKRQYRQIRPDPDFDRDMERLTHDIDMHLRPGCNPWQAVVRPSPKPPEDAGAPGKTTARPWRIGPWTTWDVAVVAAVAAGLMLIATMLAAGARQTPPPVSPSLAGEYYEMGAAFHRSAIDYEQAGMRTNMLGAYGRAASAYREAIHIQPYNGACHWNLAICLEKMGETEEAQWHWDFCAKYLGWPRGRPGCNAPPNFEQDPTTWSPPP